MFNFLLEEADSTIAEQPEDTDASLQNGPMSAKAFNDINAHKLREEGYGMSSSKDNKNKPASSSGGKTRKLWGRIKRDIDEQAHSKSLAKRLAELIINAAGNENINFTLYCTLLEPLPHVYYEIMRSSESRALLMTQVGCDELFEWTNALLSAPYHIW